MQERSASPPLGNILMFVVILVLALVVYPWMMQKFFPPPPKVANAPVAQEQKDDKAAGDKKAARRRRTSPAIRPRPPARTTSPRPRPPRRRKPQAGCQGRDQGRKAPPEKKIDEPRQWVTLGSVDPDPKNPYRMLVTLSSEGASVARLELSSEHYRDLEDRSGYLGHLVMDNTDQGPGCLVQVVGAGTPAAAAGVRPGDRILELVYQGQTTEDQGPAGLEAALRKTKPGKTVELVIRARQKTAFPNERQVDSPAAGSDSSRAEEAEHGLDPDGPLGCNQPEGEFSALVPDDACRASTTRIPTISRRTSIPMRSGTRN